MLAIRNIYHLSANPIIELEIVYALSMCPTLIHINSILLIALSR
jgi:hypothetical protein